LSFIALGPLEHFANCSAAPNISFKADGFAAA